MRKCVRERLLCGARFQTIAVESFRTIVLNVLEVLPLPLYSPSFPSVSSSSTVPSSHCVGFAAEDGTAWIKLRLQCSETQTHTHGRARAQKRTECRTNLCSNVFAPEVSNLLCALSWNYYFISFEWQKIELIRCLVGDSTGAQSKTKCSTYFIQTPTRMERMRKYIQ